MRCWGVVVASENLGVGWMMWFGVRGSRLGGVVIGEWVVKKYGIGRDEKGFVGRKMVVVLLLLA